LLLRVLRVLRGDLLFLHSLGVHPDMPPHTATLALVLSFAPAGLPAGDDGIESKVEHHYADSAGVKIHYVSLGKGPPLLLLHGFPDFWYSWRRQMEALSTKYRCLAVDLRGYNLSDKPKGVENYDLSLLAGDAAAVLRDAGCERATVVGHDWGGVIAWTLAARRPELVERLIVLNLPHPRGLLRELAQNPQQQKNSQYARSFQSPDAHKLLRAEALALLVAKEGDDFKKYVEALRRSDFEAMLHYYQRNYPREPYREDALGDFPKVKAPVLLFHGLKDPALLPGALSGTWEWLEKDLTLVTVPEAGHWVHHDAAKLVSRTMELWLERDER
jgi:pimeloyl-ACP methyl ester carboxylesterase